MATRIADRPTLKAERLLEANRASPLVYQSYDDRTGVTTYKLESGEMFILDAKDSRSIAHVQPWWRHLERI
jgi:hypothetical protein